MISVIIPAYNESLNIVETINEIAAVLESIPEGNPFEIIVIDDHSSDDTYNKVKELNSKNVKLFRLSQRCGSNTAIRAGMKAAQGEAILYFSADGQDNPNVIPEMLNKWRMGAQIVWACRDSRQSEPLLVRLPALFFYKVLRAMTPTLSSDIDVARADFYLIDRRVVDAINRCEERNTSLFGLLVWCGFNQQSVNYIRKPRRSGSSKWSFSNRLDFAKDWIIAFSGLPLKAMVWIGFLIASFGVIYALFILTTHLSTGHQVESWASLMALVLFLGGLNMAALGVIGEYLWRNLDECRKRPLYFIEKEHSR
jgi:polyisoprenyl-phosphate glycosyltransferase